MADSLDHLSHKLAQQIAAHSVEEAASEGIYVKNSSLEAAPELIQLYLQNRSIDWTLYFPKGSGRKIPLPTYPFVQKRHWPKLEVEKADKSTDERLRSFFYEVKWEEESLLPLRFRRKVNSFFSSCDMSLPMKHLPIISSRKGFLFYVSTPELLLEYWLKKNVRLQPILLKIITN